MYEFSWPTRTIFGPGLAEDAGRVFPPASTDDRLLLVTHGEPWAANLLNNLKAGLLASGWARAIVFAKVEPNPTWQTVQQGAERALALGASALLAVGGGSVLDAAKAIADKSGIERLCTMPTTAGTGGEISPWAVITDQERREKQSVVARWPELAVLDPALTISMPPATTLYTGIDAFIHGLEAFLSVQANPITDALALTGIELAASHLDRVMRHPNDLHSRAQMMQASLLSGAAMLNAGLGLIHAIGNVIGGLSHEATHGLLLAHCLPAVLEFNRPAVEPKLSRVMGWIDRATTEWQAWSEALSGGEVVVSESDLPLAVERVMANVNAKTNPRPPDREAVEMMIRQSFAVRP
jgi:alcohol dehydrogenase class IV